jgi:hypothetical protein
LSDTLICPHCHERLWVAEIQIPLVTCPKCLARVLNPNAAAEPMARRSVPRRREPRQVIAVEEETRGDIGQTGQLLRILAWIFVTGAVIVTEFFSWWLVVILIAGAVIDGVIVAVCSRRAPELHGWRGRDRRGAQREDGTRVLDYTNIANFPQERSAGGYTFGFFYAVGMVFVGFLTLDAYHAHRHRVGLSILSAAAVLGMVYFVLRSRANSDLDGFFSGAAMGLILGSVGCLPCAMITLI